MNRPIGNSRRSFLAMLGIGAVVAVDPERLLWTPGKRLISIPSDRQLISLLQFGMVRVATEYQSAYNQALSAWVEVLEEQQMDLRFVKGSQWEQVGQGYARPCRVINRVYPEIQEGR